jgi:ubiquinone/menaquinone biosynthesis C-methylase UbiE
LLEYLTYGATPSQLHGTDLLFDRVTEAKTRLSHLPLTCADGQNIPYADDSFDLVLQYTVFTSILDDTVKANLAREMLRVLRKPRGKILWYDYWLNPTNPQARGIRPTEIRKLFPGCAFQFQRVTLAPPIARRLVPLSWTFALLLEKLRLLNSHYLVAIHPPPLPDDH